VNTQQKQEEVKVKSKARWEIINKILNKSPSQAEHQG
jgi:hypothetical protein